jgi:hypothetical protein
LHLDALPSRYPLPQLAKPISIVSFDGERPASVDMAVGQPLDDALLSANFDRLLRDACHTVRFASRLVQNLGIGQRDGKTILVWLSAGVIECAAHLDQGLVPKTHEIVAPSGINATEQAGILAVSDCTVGRKRRIPEPKAGGEQPPCLFDASKVEKGCRHDAMRYEHLLGRTGLPGQFEDLLRQRVCFAKLRPKQMAVPEPPQS